MFPGNTQDAATMPVVLADLQARFGVGPIAVVADRGLISADNLTELNQAGFDHVIATGLHRDPDVAAVLEAAAGENTVWVAAGGNGRTACEVIHEIAATWSTRRLGGSVLVFRDLLAEVGPGSRYVFDHASDAS